MNANGVSLFKDKQTFMNAIFDKTLQTYRGKKHAKEYESDYNAQSENQKLSAFYIKSTNYRVRASIALSYITSAKT